MSAVKDRLVNVPVAATDILNTVKSIPRTPKEAGLIQVKLKRKLKYKNYHQHEYISPEKIFKMLDHLKISGHPYYQFYDNLDNYIQRCFKEQTNGDNYDGRTMTLKKIKLRFVNDTCLIDTNHLEYL